MEGIFGCFFLFDIYFLGWLIFSATSFENTKFWFHVLPKECFPREAVLFLWGSDRKKKKVFENIYGESTFWRGFWASFCEFLQGALRFRYCSIFVF